MDEIGKVVRRGEWNDVKPVFSWNDFFQKTVNAAQSLQKIATVVTTVSALL
jgi:hypothetical protein